MDKILQALINNLLKRQVSSKGSRLELCPPHPPTSMLALLRGSVRNLQDFVHSEGGSRRLHSGPNIKSGGEEGGPDYMSLSGEC